MEHAANHATFIVNIMALALLEMANISGAILFAPVIIPGVINSFTLARFSIKPPREESSSQLSFQVTCYLKS